MASTNVLTSLGASDIDTKELAANLVAATKEPRQKLIDAEKKKAEVAISSTAMLKNGLAALQDAATEIATVSKLNKMQISSSNSSVVTGSTVTTATAKAGTYSIEVERLATPKTMVASFASKDSILPPNTAITLSVGTSSNNFQVGGKTPLQVAAAINTWVKTTVPLSKVSATTVDSKDSGVGNPFKLILQGEPGTAGTFTITEDSGNSIPSLFVDDLTGPKTARFRVNGVTIERASNKVTDVVAGLSLDLRSKASTASVITVEPDPDSVLQEIQNFIDTFNTVTEFLKKATGPKVAGDEIAGTLQRDSAARTVLAQLRSKITAEFKEKDISIKHLSSLGITFDRAGVLKLEYPDRFKEAYAQKAAEVVTALSNDNTILDPESVLPSGLFGDVARVSNSMIKNSLSIVPRMSKGYEEKLTRVDQKQQVLDRYIERIKEQYEKQFSALNAALSSFKSTQSQLERSLNFDNKD